jgi:hypothetical protein
LREGLVDQRTGRRVAQKADEDDAVGFAVDRLFEISRQLVRRPPREIVFQRRSKIEFGLTQAVNRSNFDNFSFLGLARMNNLMKLHN